MEAILGLISIELIVAIAAPVIAIVYAVVIKEKYKQEFKTFIQIVEIIAENHNINPIDILDEILQKSRDIDYDTGNIEEATREEMQNL